MKKDPPKGFTCSCGKYVEFPVYVFAHWDIDLVYECQGCGREWTINKGRAR